MKMANIKNDPAVQALLAKAAEKAAKDQAKAVAAVLKTAGANVKASFAEAIEAAKAAEDKAGAKALAAAQKEVLATIKATEAL
jgi:TPR repeat protein